MREEQTLVQFFSGKKMLFQSSFILIIGSMSASNTALPRIRDATATDTEPSGEIPVPFSINTRTNATTCRATKKKIVGGSSAKNSSLSLVDSLLMERLEKRTQRWFSN